MHRVPVSIISDRGPQFTSHFWKAFQKALGMHLDLSTTLHPQTDGQFEKTLQILEDMLRACVLDFGGSWSHFLPMIEFIIAINLAFRWHLLKLYMEDVVDLRLAGLKLVKPNFWGQIQFKIPLKRSASLKKGF